MTKTTKAPLLNRKVAKGRSCFRRCPYSDTDFTDRIPVIERATHPVTSGLMAIHLRGGHDQVGYICKDPYCPFYLGTATTEILMDIRVQVMVSGAYSIQVVQEPIPICSGTWFFEK